MSFFAEYQARNPGVTYSFSMLDGEEKLVSEAIGGEASAFGLLYDHYLPRIYRFIYLKVGRREEAEDLTHQVFLNAWQNIKKYEHRGYPFSSWLYRISRNAVIDFYRVRKQDFSLEEVDEQRSIDELEEKVSVRLERGLLEKALRQLKQEHQDIIILRFVEELSIAETATTLNKSQGAVKLLQHRAMQKLKELMKPHA